MERAEITDANEPLRIVKTSIPSTPPEGARLLTAYAGVCHSDIHIIEDSGEYLPGLKMTRRDVYRKLGKQFSGIVPGHEIAGFIEEFGTLTKPDEFDLRVGDFVLLFPWIGCGQCDTCSSGRNMECTKNPKLVHNYGFSPHNAGGYASHVLAHKLDILVKVPDTIRKDVAAMLPCSALTAFTSLKKAANFLEEGYTRNKCAKLLVVGTGGLGLWGIQLATLMFPHLNIEVTAADINPEKLKVAKERGAEFTVLWKTKYEGIDDQLAEVQKTTKGGKYKFDAAIDFVTVPNTFALAYRSLRPAGSIISVGLFGGETKLSLLELVRAQYKIQGNTTGSLADMKELVDFLKDKNVQYSHTEYVSLHEINNTLERLKNGKILGRALIKF